MPDPRDLCVLADVKALMQKTGPSSDNQDPLISSLITRASIKIMRDYGREFVPGGPDSIPFTNATRTFEYEPGGSDETYVDLNPYDLALTPVPTVIVDTDGATPTPTTLTLDGYRPWPQPPSQGVYMALRIGRTSPIVDNLRSFRSRQFTVTGDWGFPSIPLEVTQACAETVIHWITSYPAMRAAAQPDSGIVASTPRSYPMTAVDLLSTFDRKAG